MIERFSRVVLTDDLPEEGLMAGDSGKIVDIYYSGAAYEVEFFALSGDTVAVATVESNMVRPATKADVSDARTI